jgi:transposase
LHLLRAPVRVTYQAGPTGFGLARAITGAGIECLAAAPSNLQRPAGDRVETDACVAAHLARLLHLEAGFEPNSERTSPKFAHRLRVH